MSVERQLLSEVAKAGWRQGKPTVFFKHIRKVKEELNKMPTFAEVLSEKMQEVDAKYSPDQVKLAIETWKERCYQQRPSKVSH